MVAVIKTGHSIQRILNYNENKVKERVAELISAVNYPMDAGDLSFSAKLNMLMRQATLNENVTRNSVHVSLNFDTSESIPGEVMAEIADTYMKGIGFGEQPYLVYQHFDAGHPHMHIVSVKVRPDGTRIDTQNIGRNQSEHARKAIEVAYGLKKAEGSGKAQDHALLPVNVQKAVYGRSGTKRAITNVLDAVIDHYRYASLHELNAVLQLYNVLADRGSEGSLTYKNHGLTYRILDADGNKVGVPVKASDIYMKPTLAYLESKFPGNEQYRAGHKARIKNKVDMLLFAHPGIQLGELAKLLGKEGINMVLRQNPAGLVYGVTYVDHQTRCVFNGSALGKDYSAKRIVERCGGKAAGRQQDKQFAAAPARHYQPALEEIRAEIKAAAEGIPGIFEVLLEPERSFAYVPAALTKKKRKKRSNKRL